MTIGALLGAALLHPASALGALPDTPAPWIEQAWHVLTLRAGFNASVVLLASVMLGIAAGVAGTFALLRSRAMMADALAHATLPGVALAFLLASALGAEGKSLPVLLAGAAATGLLGIWCVHAVARHTRLHEDSAIAIVLSTFFGAGIVLLSYIQSLPSGGQAGLNHFIFGQPATMRTSDGTLIAGAAAGCVVLAALFLKELRAVCFDDRFAASIGVPVPLADALIMGLVAVVAVIGLQAVGLLMVVAMLTIPPATARLWTDRLGVMVALAGCVGGAGAALGVALSGSRDHLPAGATVVLATGSLFALSMLGSPTRGAVALGLRRVRLRVRTAAEHALRRLYESLETAGADGTHAPSAAPAPAFSAGPIARYLLVWRGLVRRSGSGWTLTERGLEQAARVTRRHRLWEEFLVSHADLAASHVDASADLVEHALSPRILDQLEDSLRRRGRLPEPDALPGSVHALRPPNPSAPRART